MTVKETAKRFWQRVVRWFVEPSGEELYWDAEPDELWRVNGQPTAMMRQDWEKPPYREVRCPCGARSPLAERATDSLGRRMQAEMSEWARRHLAECPSARASNHAHYPECIVETKP